VTPDLVCPDLFLQDWFHVQRGEDLSFNLESIQPNFDFFIFLIFAFKLGHFKVQAIFSYAKNTQA
jgi:hypothetical protein